MLDPEHLASAREARLHLIGDQQDTVHIADPAERDEQLWRRDVEAAFSLDGLDDDRADLLGLQVGREQEAKCAAALGDRRAALGWERDVVDAGWRWPEGALVGRHLAGHRGGQQRPAVETAGEGDHARPAGRGARDLHRILGRLGAGGEQDRLRRSGERRERIQALGKGDIAFIGRDLEGGVREPGHLSLGCGDHLGVTVTDVEHRDAAGEVDIAAALDVPQLGVVRAVGVDGGGRADPARDGGGAARGEGGVAEGHAAESHAGGTILPSAAIAHEATSLFTLVTCGNHIDVAEPDDPRLPPFAALRSFEMFGRVGGVRRAAERLGVSHAIVSRQLRALEAWMGVPLIDRDTRSLTPAGAAYHARVVTGFAALRDATAEARHGRDRVELWCAPGLAYLWLIPRLDAAVALSPSVMLDVRPSESAPRFGHDTADAELRFVLDGAEPSSPHLRWKEVLRPPVFPVAHPDLAGRIASEATGPADLQRYPLLHEQDTREWTSWLAAQGSPVDRLPAAGRLWHAHLVLAAAREGRGIALTNPILASADLEAGRVVPVATRAGAIAATSLGAYVFAAPAERWNLAPLRRLRQWLTSSLPLECVATRSTE